ncbi:HAMP domain-containing histidine kinase, partial [Candidatus Fermentibacteria bacterium]|nr:HAMP domain-containing histidine kinase [Candidatus Fermentibacteria bacterium]
MKRLFGSRLPLLVFAGLLSWIFLFYSHNLVRRLDETNRRANDTIARFWAGTQIPFSIIVENRYHSVCTECGLMRETSGPGGVSQSFCPVCMKRTAWITVPRWTDDQMENVLDLTRSVFRQLTRSIDYPTVITDNAGQPQIVNGDPVPFELPGDVLAGYKLLIQKLDEANSPIPMLGLEGDTIGWLHYGSGSLSRELSMVPYVELAVLLLLAVVLLFGVRSELRREKEMAWMGFAKETAHQLGTPLSSLMGWIELLRQRPGLVDDPELAEAVDCMETDVSRLGQIASRYGEMGKKPRLKRGSVNEVVSQCLYYFRSRPGLVPEGVELEAVTESRLEVMLNSVLMGWVLENLVKNALAAVTGQVTGAVTVLTRDLREGSGVVEISVSDNGRGIPFRDQSRIFQAGFTTRRGGWGLGLTLSRRIVEEYHGGSIRL